jgi:hypothetical protein
MSNQALVATLTPVVAGFALSALPTCQKAPSAEEIASLVPHGLVCRPVLDDPRALRCHNDEVVCYYFGSHRGVQCNWRSKEKQ